MVAIDNILKPAIVRQNSNQLIVAKMRKVPLVKNGEPKFIIRNKVKYTEMKIEINNISFIRANNAGDRNTCFLWLNNNTEYCLQACISLIKLGKQHIDANLLRISKFEMVRIDRIESYVLHHTVMVDGRILIMGRKFMKKIDALLLSIPRLN